MTKALMIAAMILGTAMTCTAMDSSDLLFHLSFNNGVSAEFARGSAQPLKKPENVAARLVQGLFGKGYAFRGKASDLDFATGENGGPRACAEMYGPKANFFGDSGTVAFWIKPLPNTHNMVSAFFRYQGPGGYMQICRNQYMHHQFNYGAKDGYIYDGLFQQNPWIFFAMTWRKDEARAYYNGNLMTVLRDTGVMKPTADKFEVACEGMSWLDFQTKKFADDAVMDELQIFRRPLADEEIRSLFERGHVTTRQQVGNIPDSLVSKPERAYSGTVLTAPKLPAPITVDGKLDKWQNVPAQGGWIERRLGVLDNDDAKVYAACDAQTLYLAFRCPVDEALQKDPTHIWYPTGQFKAGMTVRDSDVHGDDYLEFVIKNKAGHEYRIAVNAKGAVLDSRDGDTSWNTSGKIVSRSDFQDWTAEMAIPLVELGLALGDTVDFNVIRSWKLFKSAQNTLCADERSQPTFGKLTLGGDAAAVASLGKPWNGALEISGTIAGAAGNYIVSVEGKGYNQHFAEKQTIAVANAPAAFAIKRKLEKPGDLGVVVRVVNPAGKEILVRSVPFVYVAASTVELENYPGWGRLKVNVVPVDTNGVKAVVSLEQAGKALMSREIPAFPNPEAQVAFDTTSLSVGEYQVATRMTKGGAKVFEDRQPFVKKPLPEWYHCKAGVIDAPPVPWTPVKASAGAVQLLGKEVTFDKSLFPSRIVANGQELLAGPARIRIKRGGKDAVLAAGEFGFTKNTSRQAEWTSTAKDGDLTATVKGRIEFDGFTWMDLTLSGGKVDHLQVEIPLRRAAATLTTLGSPLMTDSVMKTPLAGYWFGNERAGFAYWWEDMRGWESNGEAVSVVPANAEVVIAIPFLQKPVDLKAPRTIAFGWVATPTKPVRKDWRTIALYRGIGYSAGDYTFTTPNYPKARDSAEGYQREFDRLKQPWRSIVPWYAFGPYMWVGAPEYAEWWREWRNTPSALVKPDPNSTAWGPCCHNSSGSDLHLWRLEQFVKHYPQRGIYIDCMGSPSCNNEAHGCGYVNGNGVRQCTGTLLATRRHYERMYNIIKASDPVYGWVWYDGWAPLPPPWGAFADDNLIGEGYIGPLCGAPQHNYYNIVDLPTARVNFLNAPWGHLNSWLTEMACTAGDDREQRAGWYGKMLSPPKDGKPGQWILPRWKDYEHVAGLGLLHDMWSIGGNDLQLAWLWGNEIKRMMHWDDNVRFVGYWELGDQLQVDGAVPEKIACSVYYRPAGLAPFAAPVGDARKASYVNFTVADDVKTSLAKAGDNPKGWLILAPMNNTDADVVLTLKPNLAALGFPSLANGQASDLFRACDFRWGPPGWLANNGDPESPNITVPGKPETFAVLNGAVKVTVPKRSFRMLLLGEKTQVAAILAAGEMRGANPQVTAAVRQISRRGGQFHFDAAGNLIGVDLASNRVSIADADIPSLLVLPHLKQLTLSGGGVTNVGVKQLGAIAGLVELSLLDAQIDDAGLKSLTQLRKLSALRVRRSPGVTDQGLQCLKNLPNLTSLSLLEVGITDEGLKLIGELTHLRVLDLRGCAQVGNPGLELLRSLKKLKCLRLGGSQIDDQSLAIVKGLSSLTSLTLEDAAITDAGLAQLAKLPMEDLSIARCYSITDEGFQRFRDFVALRQLSLRGIPITGSGLLHLRDNEKLTALRLNETGIDDAAMERLAGLKRLARLELRQTHISDAALAYLADLPNLEFLDLSQTQITDAAIDLLRKLNHLKTLKIGQTGISPAGFKKLVQLLPGCRVVSDTL